MKLIQRDFYLNKLKNVMGTPDIKVITGIRRSGKSKLLESFIDYIKSTNKNANIIHINYNFLVFNNIQSAFSLNDYVENLYDSKKDNFLFIDEVQMCKDFEIAINSFHASEKYDIYITGSNAFLLSNDLATLFTGRTFEIHVYPFSFTECKKYFDFTDNDDVFDFYVNNGGMAGSYVYKTQEEKYSYISEIFNTLIVRDILQKHNIRNSHPLLRLHDEARASQRGIGWVQTSD